MDIKFVGKENFECGKKSIQEVLIKFSEMIGLPICVKNAHGNLIDSNKSEEKIHIYFWSSADRNRRSDILPSGRMFFGSPINSGATYSFCNEPENIYSKRTNINSPEGYTVAEYHKDRPNSLHILYDLPHQNKLNAKTQLEGIMKQYYLLAHNKEEIVRILTARIKTEIAKKDRSSNNEIYLLKEKLLSAEMAIKEKNDRQADNANFIKYLSRKEKKEFDKIKKEAEITFVSGKKITKTTDGDTIIFHNKIGLYEIFIGKEEIPFHIICTGSAKVGVAQFIGVRQYYTAFQIINRWIKNYKNRGGK